MFSLSKREARTRGPALCRCGLSCCLWTDFSWSASCFLCRRHLCSKSIDSSFLTASIITYLLCDLGQINRGSMDLRFPSCSTDSLYLHVPHPSTLSPGSWNYVLKMLGRWLPLHYMSSLLYILFGDEVLLFPRLASNSLCSPNRPWKLVILLPQPIQ